MSKKKRRRYKRVSARNVLQLCVQHGGLLGLLLIAQGTVAQEIKDEWTVWVDGKKHGTYFTQQSAVTAIKSLPPPNEWMPDVYHHVDRIRNVDIAEDGTASITYWLGDEQPRDPEWTYEYGDVRGGTEADAVGAIIAEANADYSECGQTATAVPVADWVGEDVPGIPEFAENIQDRTYKVAYLEGDDCTQSGHITSITRQRRLDCPVPYTEWRNTHHACVDENIAVVVKTKTLECGALAGNPCDVTNGDKFEQERDITLDWISFERAFHSASSVKTGGFGQGWTHSHEARLAIGAGSMGLIEGSGYMVRFRDTGNAYVSVGRQHDRIVANGSGWTLLREDSVWKFDKKGGLVEKQWEDGTSLHYTYDGVGRLSMLTHSTGRALQLAYGGPSRAAPIISISMSDVLLVTYGYNALGQVALATYADGGSRQYHYENSVLPTLLTGITAEDGQRYSSFVYDDFGRVVSSSHHDGADAITLSYSATGTTTVTDALGLVTTYGMDAAIESRPRKLAHITDAAGKITQTFNPPSSDFAQRVDEVVDRKGISTRHLYSQQLDTPSNLLVNVHTTHEASGIPEQRTFEERHAVDSGRLVMRRVGALEKRVTRNTRLQPVTVNVRGTGVDSSRTQDIIYCEEEGVDCPQVGLLRSVNGPRTDVDDITKYAYYVEQDAGCATNTSCNFRKGDLHSITNALGHVTETLAYDSAGRPLSVRDPNGVITDYTYHPRGWLTSTSVRGATSADDRITQVSYWPTGRVQQITQPDGASITYVYDAAQRLTDIADGAGNTIHYTLDNAGNRLQENIVDDNGTLRRTLARVYDTLGQLIELNDGNTSANHYAYDANSNLEQVTDPLQHVTSRQYDALNRPTQLIQDEGGIAATTQMAYNAHDLVTRVIDPNGLETRYGYNAFGDLIEVISPDSGTTGFTVDAAGNRLTRTDARGITTTYTYDALNRLTHISYPDTALDVGFGYDVEPSICTANERFAKGRLGSVTHAGGSTAYCYDRFGQITRKAQTVGGVTTVLAYTYSKAGQQATVTYPDASVVDYQRDAQGRVHQIGLTRPGQSRQVVLRDVSYAPFGPATSWTYGDGRVLERALTLDYRADAVRDQEPSGLSLSYGYDATRNLTQLKDGNGAPLAQYSYDGIGRLTHTRDGMTGDVIEAYAYDKTGNRTGMTNAAGEHDYTYAQGSHHLLSVGGEDRQYDAAGNTTGIGTRTFTYSDANRMSAVAVDGAVAERYTYNHLGERVQRGPVGAAARTTLYDEAGRWLGDYNEQGGPVQQAIWLDDSPIALLTDAAGGITQLAYIQPDHLGTPRVVIDPAKNEAIWTWRNQGEVFGHQIPSADPDGDGVTFELALRFPGQQATDAGGLFYNYQREYDPGSGRYTQSDPIGLVGGVNTYAYVAGDPASMIDPRGLRTVLITTYNYGFGTHSAIHVSSPGAPDFLYDPSGTYAPGGRRWSSGGFEGEDASLSAYRRYQEGTGSRVVETLILLSPEQERALRRNAEEISDPRWFLCAVSVSSALDGMCGIPLSFTPGGLHRRAEEAVCPKN